MKLLYIESNKIPASVSLMRFLLFGMFCKTKNHFKSSLHKHFGVSVLLPILNGYLAFLPHRNLCVCVCVATLEIIPAVSFMCEM